MYDRYVGPTVSDADCVANLSGRDDGAAYAYERPYFAKLAVSEASLVCVTRCRLDAELLSAVNEPCGDTELKEATRELASASNKRYDRDTPAQLTDGKRMQEVSIALLQHKRLSRSLYDLRSHANDNGASSSGK